LLVCCVCVCLGDGHMKLVTLPDAVKSGARCLDGSPPAFYYRAATDSKYATKWVIYIQGGGWCYKDEACLDRAKTSLGSSTQMAKTMGGAGVMSDSATVNPEFHAWNHVVLAYCDGGSFSGARIDPVTVGGKKIYYRGYYNLKAIFDALKSKYGMNKATEVLLTGGSAGGVATFIHADQIASMLPKTVKKYKASPFSGMFMRHVNVNNEVVYENQLKHVFEIQNCTYGVDTHCLAGKKPEDKHLCMFGQETIKYTMTPMFVMNSMYDAWSLRCIMTAEPVQASSPQNYNCSRAPGWYHCVEEETCSKTQFTEINTKWADDYRSMIKANTGLKNRGNGLFAYSCHEHGAEVKGNYWQKTKVNGVTMHDAFMKWYNSNNEEASKHTYTDCTINGNFHCNPTCAAN